MSFTEDFRLLRLVLAGVGAVSLDGVTVLPLTILSLFTTLLRLVRDYRYTAANATSALERFDPKGYVQHLKRRAVVETIMKTIDSHGITAVVLCSGDLIRLLVELDVQYETRMKPLAAEACISRPMLYGCGFNYRSPVLDRNAGGPIVGIEGRLEVYGLLHSYNWKSLGPDKTVHYWRQTGSFTDYITSFYNQGRFFGPTTRTTQLVCFRFSNASVRLSEHESVVRRHDWCLILTTSLEYDPVAKELVYVPALRGHKFQLVCQRHPSDKDKTRVSLATSLKLEDSDYGVQMTRIHWIDAEPMSNDDMRYSTTITTGIGLYKRKGFPYNMQRSYRTWHVVMGNGCRIKVRVSLGIGIGQRIKDPRHRWTLTNTEDHDCFAECASMLQQYYSFQGESGCVHPLDSTTVAAFVAENEWQIANLHWLAEARLERPSATGTPPTRFADHQTSCLLHAMVLKGLITRLGKVIEYSRFSTVSSE